MIEETDGGVWIEVDDIDREFMESILEWHRKNPWIDTSEPPPVLDMSNFSERQMRLVELLVVELDPEIRASKRGKTK